jgi:hypothetical protein
MKVCLTTYIYGDKYQDYIPLLVYSIHKTYPDYHMMLFLNGKLRNDIAWQLRENDLYHNLEFRENVFADCPQMSPLKAMTFRWVLWDDRFKEFDYIYVIDTDILYIRESLPLHEQHEKHLQTLKLPFSNIVRHRCINARGIHAIGGRVTAFGLSDFCRWYRSHGKVINRITGLHFIKLKEYYSVLTSDRLAYYTGLIYQGKIAEKAHWDNEAFLYWMLEQEGFPVENMSVMQNPVNMLDFNNPERGEFRPHHGIHWGIFRHDVTRCPVGDYRRAVLDSAAYNYYIDVLKKEIIPDETFQRLVATSNKNIKRYIKRMFNYYSIEK